MHLILAIISVFELIISMIIMVVGLVMLIVVIKAIRDFIYYLYDITPLWVLVSVGTFLVLLAFGFFLNWYKEKKGRCFLGLKY